MNKTAAHAAISRNALVVEGGAMRGIFAAGVLDAFLKNNFNPFELCIGVSAGASNIAAYLGQQHRRNYRVYTEFCTNPEFISWKKFFCGGHLMDLDWLWDISIREIRLDLKKIFSSGKEFLVGVTSAVRGRAVFLKPDESTCEQYLKVSSAVPLSYRTIHSIGGVPMVDGGIGASIPAAEAWRRGGQRIMAIRTQPLSYVRRATFVTKIHAFAMRKYPCLRQAMLDRADRYMQEVAFLRNPPRDVRIIEVAPPAIRTSRFTKDLHLLEKDYHAGIEQGLTAMKRWNESRF